MDFAEFEKRIIDAADRMKNAGGETLAALVESDALRFVDDNFQNQAWEGLPWKKRDPDPDPGRGILTLSGMLRDGFRSHIEPGQIRIVNAVKYAKVHNEGFRGVVYVKPHKRAQFKKKGKGKKQLTGRYNVKGFGKRLNMPQRQFAPTPGSPSQTLNSTVSNTISNFILKSFEEYQEFTK